MAIDFDFDPDEDVTLGGRPMTLRTAVEEYLTRDKALATGGALAPVMVNRDPGKTPSFFDIEELEQLAQLPEFARRR